MHIEEAIGVPRIGKEVLPEENEEGTEMRWVVRKLLIGKVSVVDEVENVAAVVYAVVSPEMGENVLVERREVIGEVVAVVWWPKIFNDTSEAGTTLVRAADG